MSNTRERFDAAIEDGLRLVNDWTQLERRIRATIPDLAAAAYDREPGDQIVWCDSHERPVAACHRNDELCTGTPLARHTDPTGDAAVTEPYKDAGEFTAWAKRVAHGIEQMVRIAGRYKPDDPQLSLEMEEANSKPDGCELCARLERWSPRHTAKPTDVGGILHRSMLVCEPHYDFIRTRARVPSEDEDTYYASKGKWPKQAGQVDRMRVNVLQNVQRS